MTVSWAADSCTAGTTAIAWVTTASGTGSGSEAADSGTASTTAIALASTL